MLKKIVLIAIMLCMIAPVTLGPAIAQQGNVCRLSVTIGPPAFYADDQCVNIPTDAIPPAEQALVVYRLRFKEQSASSWYASGIVNAGTTTYTQLPCGTYTVEATSIFQDGDPDQGCTTSVTKVAKPPKPGACSLQ